jgi:hypothetical protein
MSENDEDSAIQRELAAVLQRKAEGRREISRRSFGEKIAMMEALRERLAPLKRARERRRSAQKAKAAPPQAEGDPDGSLSATSAGSNS